tara:strand:+ start:2549 stop:4855 length:2307 start_codon:yes stop_codon:yes gene_type:complete
MPRYDKYGPKDDRALEDLDLGFIGFNNRLRPDQLAAGMLAECNNARLDRTGSWNLREGVDSIGAPIATGVDALVLPFTLAADDTDAAIADPDSNSGNLVITNITGSLYANSGTINLSNVSGISNPDPNGDQPYTKTATNELTVTGSFTGAADASVTVKYPILNDDAVNQVYGSCSFSDPNSNNNESYIIIATNVKAVAIKVSDPSTSIDIPYDTNILISDTVNMIQAFNKVYIFRKGSGTTGVVALEIDLAANDINSLGAAKFTAVSSGAFTQKVAIACSEVAVSNGTCTCTPTSSGDIAKLKEGEELTVTVAGNAGSIVSGLAVDVKVKVSTISTTTFTFVLNVADLLAGSNEVTFEKPFSSNLGFIHMPTPEFGILHQRRLIMPFQFDPENSNASRKIFDEVIASDILDSDTYDKIFASFRFNAGASDFTVGITSFTEDSILIFNKNSIFRVTGTLDPATSNTQILTNEIGALARKSIIQVGQNVFFLSDNGVYSLEFFDEFNLRGTQTPLSEPIQETISQINLDFASNAVAVYFDNRYFLAVPLKTNPDGSDNISGANNAIIIYNFLNKQWESIDTINTNPQFEYTDLLVAGLGKKRGVYTVNQQGGIHLIATEKSSFSQSSRSGFDNVITRVGSTDPTTIRIEGKLKTRMYTYQDIGRKKFNSFDITAEGNEFVDTDFSIKIETENIDTDLGTQKSTLGNASDYKNNNKIEPQSPPEDVAIRGRIGNMRAYGAQIQIENVEGTPSIRNIKTRATKTFRSINTAE